MTEKVAEAIGRLWFQDWAGEPFEKLAAESQALWIARANRVWDQVRGEVETDAMVRLVEAEGRTTLPGHNHPGGLVDVHGFCPGCSEDYG